MADNTSPSTTDYSFITSQPLSEQPNKRSKIIVILLIVLGLVAFSIIGLLVFGNVDRTKSNSIVQLGTTKFADKVERFITLVNEGNYQEAVLLTSNSQATIPETAYANVNMPSCKNIEFDVKLNFRYEVITAECNFKNSTKTTKLSFVNSNKDDPDPKIYKILIEGIIL